MTTKEHYLATYGGNDFNGDDKAPEGVEQIMVN